MKVLQMFYSKSIGWRLEYRWYKHLVCYDETNMCIMELFGYCKGGYFNIHIWAWFRAFICSKSEIRFYLFGKKIGISCSSRSN